MESDITELFKRASEDNDPQQKFKHVEILITKIKIKHGIEAPFKKSYGGSVEVARKLYMEGKYEECIYELRRVKSDITREISKLQNAYKKSDNPI